MMHFTCDRCGKTIGRDDRRHVVRIEIAPAAEAADLREEDVDADHLKEVADLIKAIDADPGHAAAPSIPRSFRCDLCGDCAESFVRAPVGQGKPQPSAFCSPN